MISYIPPQDDLENQYRSYDDSKEFIKTSLQALNLIKDISISHTETDEDENWDGEWEYTTYDVYDGTISEQYPYCIDLLENDLKALEVLKKIIPMGVTINNKGEYHLFIDDISVHDTIPLTKEQAEALKKSTILTV